MIQSKITSIAELKKLLKKKRHHKVVFTNGCFDVLHAGHVTYLEKAKRLGDILIVALNTDASTRRLKGPSRPVNTLQDRLRVVAALESVDYVTWFGEETPIRLIQSLSPNVLVKGGDYAPKEIVGYDHVKKSGGQVRVIRFLPGRSTTLTLNRLKNASNR